METGSLLRDYFDVPYLSLSALNVKWQQIIVLGKAFKWEENVLIIVWIDGHSLALALFRFKTANDHVCVYLTACWCTRVSWRISAWI